MPEKGAYVMTIAVGCDGMGTWLKDILVEHLHQKGIETIDVGSYAGQPKRRYYAVAQDVAECIQAGKEKGVELPRREERIGTNFIR